MDVRQPGWNNVRHGDLIIDRDENTGKARVWLLFQREEGSPLLYGAHLIFGPWRNLTLRYYRAVVTFDDLVEHAYMVTSDLPRYPIIITDTSFGDALWVPQDVEAVLDGDSETLWYPMAKFSFGRPHGSTSIPIRWIRLSTFFPTSPPPIFKSFQVPSRPPDLIDLENQILSMIVERFSDVIRVRPCIEIADDRFLIRFFDAEDGSEISLYSTILTEDARAVLRDPVIHGVPYSTGDGMNLTWDPYSDINYGHIGEIPLSVLHPYVIRSTDHFDLPLPETAIDLASMKIGPAVTVIVHHDSSRCPMRDDIHDACWTVEIIGDIGSSVKRIEKKPLFSHEVVWLMNTPLLIDLENNLLHPLEIEFNVAPSLNPPIIFIRDSEIRDALIRAGVKFSVCSLQAFEEGWQPDLEFTNEPDYDDYDEPDYDTSDELNPRCSDEVDDPWRDV